MVSLRALDRGAQARSLLRQSLEAVFSALRETFGDRDLVSITPEEVQEWIED